MLSICFYFQLHQPFRINHYRIKQIGKHASYFDERLNKRIFYKVASKCYWPAGKLFLSMLQRFPEFKLTFSISGAWLEQCERYDPALLELYQEIMAQPNVEILCETSAHSLASLNDSEEFYSQIVQQKKNIQRLFNRETNVFRNTELIYSDAIGQMIYELGFNACLLEGFEPNLPEGYSPHNIFKHPKYGGLKLIPKSYRLSDDIAFRFSNNSWPGWPLTADKYHSWVETLIQNNSQFVGLFMDYETFGEHQWADTGIFSFIEQWVYKVLHDKRMQFLTTSEVAETIPAKEVMRVESPMSWADSERDISAWLGNGLQEDALDRHLNLKPLVKQAGDRQLLSDWRKLAASDHFYYMCIKSSADADVHKYFSPYDSPYDSYLNYVNILEDLQLKLQAHIAAQKQPAETSDDFSYHVLEKDPAVHEPIYTSITN